MNDTLFRVQEILQEIEKSQISFVHATVVYEMAETIESLCKQLEEKSKNDSE